MINVSSFCFSTSQKRLCLLMLFWGIRKGRFFLCCVGVNQKWYNSKGQKLDDAVPMHFSHSTVDSSEIRRSPVDMVVYPLHLYTWVLSTSKRWLALRFLVAINSIYSLLTHLPRAPVYHPQPTQLLFGVSRSTFWPHTQCGICGLPL